ncbi:zinc ribbon domain-containing protein [Ruminococcus sp.]|uniref:zinc-ribbon domain-containing protein n=1 Tax=Ruminococcus sp. TaxID=41978 RepID=UPI001B7832FE|nr:zinc ribbon domain-containing protein [Ruminococcus sp.]MBP5431797.1 zinc ribbon domain-containing protein [Ruminococcus sp.]
MYCKHCGAQIPDGSETCTSCGGDLKPKTAPLSAGGASVKELANSVTDIAAQKTSGMPLLLIAKVCVLVALVAFFLPFVSVSCTKDKSIKENYSGFRMMFSIEKKDDDVAKNADSDPKPNVFLLAAFAGGVATAVVLFRKSDKKSLKIASIVSAASAAAILLFRMTFRSYYDIPKEYSEYIKVNTKFGLLLSILMMLATAAACYLEISSAKPAVIGAAASASTPAPSETASAPSEPPADQPPEQQ